MGILIENGTVVTLGKENKIIEDGAVYIEGNTIKEVGTTAEVNSRIQNPESRIQKIDAKGKIVMPGLINTHHHLYSTFARGMAIPGEPAKNFVEILERLWWPLDKTLNKEDIYYSALIPLIECVRNGTTTIIDHHESQTYQLGSLDELERAAREMGIRSCFCLGVSDRYDRGKEGLEESERFLKKLQDPGSRIQDHLISSMVGLHASFTVNDDTLEKAVALAKKYDVGIHAHCAEDKADEEDSVKKYGKRVVERFRDKGVLGPKSILVHGVHLDEKEMDILKKTKTNLVHNPESNMNNAVGWADVLKMIEKGVMVGLGTDGMSSDMLSQMRCAYLIARNEKKDPRVAFMEAPRMLLENNPKIISQVTPFGKLGEISIGSLADVVLIDYLSPTPLNENNFLGHLIFGLVDATIDTTIVNGKILMENKRLVGIDEEKITAKSKEL
ncbi:putative aminohydrolase SsnA, partial [bacterium]|nr:putative aminohydrolase SsnA [bacterium]